MNAYAEPWESQSLPPAGGQIPPTSHAYVRGLEFAARLVEAQRQAILENPSDPSWTEHLAEVHSALLVEINRVTT